MVATAQTMRAKVSFTPIYTSNSLNSEPHLSVDVPKQRFTGVQRVEVRVLPEILLAKEKCR